MAANGQASRVDWVDAAKGICIILVVMLHSTLGVEEAAGREGFMHYAVAFTRPFRMPDFFLISGLFLGLTIDKPWRRYLDRKVVHFFYFYLLWLAIQFAFKAPGMAAEGGFAAPVEALAQAFWQPFGTLWFIYMLPVFFLFTRLVKTLPVWFVAVWAAFLEMLPIDTGSVIFDEFCARYVYFFIGYAFAANIFALARWVEANARKTLGLLAVWAVVEVALVFTPAPAALAFLLQPDLGNTGATLGWAELPLISLALGLAGALTIVAIASLVSKLAYAGWLAWLGAHSIVVYLGFFLPMATARAVLIKLGIIESVGLMSLVVLSAGVIGPVVLYFIVQRSGYGKFLFERPDWASIDRPRRAKGMAAAE